MQIRLPAGHVAQTNLQLFDQLTDAGWDAADQIRAARAYDVAIRVADGIYRRTGKPHVSHLVGTASIVLQTGARPDVVLAALLHDAYASGTSARPLVLDAVGPAAEALVTAYARDRRSRLPSPDDVDGLPEEGRDGLLLLLANELEDQIDRGAGYGPPVPPALLLEMGELADRLGEDELGAALRDVAKPTPVVAPFRRTEPGVWTTRRVWWRLWRQKRRHR